MELGTSSESFLLWHFYYWQSYFQAQRGQGTGRTLTLQHSHCPLLRVHTRARFSQGTLPGSSHMLINILAAFHKNNLQLLPRNITHQNKPQNSKKRKEFLLVGCILAIYTKELVDKLESLIKGIAQINFKGCFFFFAFYKRKQCF